MEKSYSHIQSQFVPYEIAVKLKELGFDEPCFGSHAINEDNGNIEVLNHCQWHHLQFKYEDTEVPTILWQQAFDWFRVEHNAVVCWNWHSRGTLEGDEWILHEERTTRKELINWSFEIDYYGANFDRELTGESDYGDYGYDTYESARLACLEKLIELVTEKKK